MLTDQSLSLHIRDAPFDFWGGGLDYYFQLCFFFWKISTQFFFLAPTLKQTFFLTLEKK